jgi:hypothetical protein
MKIDGITRLFPRLDGASGGFAFDLVSDRDKAATELFGKLSKTEEKRCGTCSQRGFAREGLFVSNRLSLHRKHKAIEWTLL